MELSSTVLIYSSETTSVSGKRSPDIKVLSGQIIKLLDSKTLALQLGRKARKRFLENYALEVYK